MFILFYFLFSAEERKNNNSPVAGCWGCAIELESYPKTLYDDHKPQKKKKGRNSDQREK